jgi:site-specific DNA-methyltransferase (adenine-specific)
MSTNRGDLVLDPFGGSGTTFVVCEGKERRWIGMEVDYANEIIERLETDDIRAHKNDDFVEG